MPRRGPNNQTPSKPDRSDLSSYVTVRELDARISTLMGELKWHRALMGLMALAIASPKVGGPAVSQLTAQVIHHLT